MKTAILSDGGWGSALSRVLADNGHQVVMWGPFPEYLQEMAATGENRKFLKGIKFHSNVKFEPNMAKAVNGAEIIVLATPTQYLRSVLEQLQIVYPAASAPLLVNVAKGISQTDRSLLEMAAAYRFGKLRTLRLVYLPSVKPYFASGVNTAMGLAWKSGAAAEAICLPEFAIGTQIYSAKLYLESPDLFAWTAVVILLSFALERLISHLLGERKGAAV